ncbi:MAG: glutaredoxin family protein [Acidobacteriota bacterium]
MAFRFLGVTSVTLVLGVWACREAAPPASRVSATELPAIRVTAQAKMLFTFASGSGFETVPELAKVPADRRGWVRVVDLGVKPDRRLDQELVYVADLRSVGKDGSYPYVVMSRETFESAARTRGGEGAASPASAPAKREGSAKVVLYSTSWCPACRTAREYLRGKGIPFLERDIEKDQGAAAELLEKAKRAGISASGVPVLEINGTLVQGFDPERVNHLLGAKP